MLHQGVKALGQTALRRTGCTFACGLVGNTDYGSGKRIGCGWLGNYVYWEIVFYLATPNIRYDGNLQKVVDLCTISALYSIYTNFPLIGWSEKYDPQLGDCENNEINHSYFKKMTKDAMPDF